MTNTRRALIGDLSLELEDGTTLHASTDVGLAEMWAERQYGDAWLELSYGEKLAEVTEALRSLRAAANGGEL